MYDVDAVIEQREGVRCYVAAVRLHAHVRAARDDDGADPFFLEEVHVFGADDGREGGAFHPAQGAFAHAEQASGLCAAK
jgi:hypothetical protein